MRVRVLGGLSVDGLVERDLGSRKARTLMKVLAVARGSPVPADRLADVLWGDEPPARPADQIGVLVSRLRGVIGPDRLVRSDAGYALRADWLDLDELEERVREATEALRAGRLGAAGAAASAATTLARGGLLPEEDGEWVAVERAAAEALAATARRIGAEAAERSGDHVGAVAAAESALAHDPYDEAALRTLMRAHVAAGRPASALGAYVRVRERLGDDLGVSPTAETEALHDAIVVDDMPVSTAVATVAELPGRQAELRALDDALAAASARPSPVTVAVVGEAGIGKTALVERWCATAGGRAIALVGRCDPLGRDLPLQPVADAVAAHLAGVRQEERAALLGDDAAVLAPLLGLGGSSRPGGATVVDDPDVGRARLFNALLAVVVRLAGQRVPAVVVDDVHLAGESTLAWLHFAVRRPCRLLVVMTCQPGLAPAKGAFPATSIHLGPLDLDAAAVLVGAERAGELHARSGGHPLLLRALAAAKEGEEPATIHEAIAHRIDRLGPAAATVRTAAVLGGEIDLDLLGDVSNTPVVELLGHLEAAVAAGVLAERGIGFAFRHEIEREALVERAGAARRALVHRDAARALAARNAPDPLVVAVHARLGGDADLAVRCFVRAAEIALARYDTAAAETFVGAALDLAEAPAAFATRARLRTATSRLDEAAEDARRAVAGGGGAEAFEVAGWVAYYRRRYDEALGFAEAAVEQATDQGVRASGLALAGRVRHGAGALAGAVADLERATALDAPSHVRALAGIWLAQARAHQGRPAEAMALLDRVLVDPDNLPHPFAHLHARFTRVLALGQLGRAVEALEACDDLDEAVARTGEAGARMAGPAANVRAWILRWTGQIEEADEHNHLAVTTHHAGGLRGEAYYAGMLDLADGRLLAGDFAGAVALVERMAGIEGWGGTMAWHQRHRWNLVRARLALAGGDRDAAVALSAEVARDAASRGARRYELFARATGALAGDAAVAEPGAVNETITGLEACAALDGRYLVEALTPLRDRSR